MINKNKVEWIWENGLLVEAKNNKQKNKRKQKSGLVLLLASIGVFF